MVVLVLIWQLAMLLLLRPLLHLPIVNLSLKLLLLQWVIVHQLKKVLVSLEDQVLELQLMPVLPVVLFVPDLQLPQSLTVSLFKLVICLREQQPKPFSNVIPDAIHATGKLELQLLKPNKNAQKL